MAEVFELFCDHSAMVADELQESTSSISRSCLTQELHLPLQSVRMFPNFADDLDVLRAILSLDHEDGQVVRGCPTHSERAYLTLPLCRDDGGD